MVENIHIRVWGGSEISYLFMLLPDVYHSIGPERFFWKRTVVFVVMATIAFINWIVFT